MLALTVAQGVNYFLIALCVGAGVAVGFWIIRKLLS